MNAAGRRWSRRELRRRWRSVAVLAVLTALAGGAAMAAVVGARRSVVVVQETMQEHRQPDVMSLPNLPGFDWSEIVELPYVESYGLFAATPICLSETGGLESLGQALCDQPPVEGGWFESIWRFDVLSGRFPTGPDEIAVNRLAQARYGWEVGDRLHVETVGPGRLDEFWEGRDTGRRPWGPSFEVTVTGIVAGGDAWRILTGGVAHPGFVLSSSFIPAHGSVLEFREQAFLRLRGGEADIGRLRDDIARITGDPAFPLRNVREGQRRVERSTGTEATALVLFAAAVAAAASVLIGQALARLVRAGGNDARVLRSLGMAPGALVRTLAAPGAVVAILGAAGAAAVAIAASPLVPIGVARRFDLHAGVKVDLAVLAVGAVGVAAAVGLAAVVIAMVAVRARQAPSARSPEGAPTPFVDRLRLPLVVALGARMALERRPGGDAIPVRPALAGAAVGVLAVVAALEVRHGIADTLAHPERAGRTWDLAYFPELSEDVIAADDDVARAATVTRTLVDLEGIPVPAYAFRPVGEALHRVVIEGRLPERSDEVALGPSTASALDVDVGDDLRAGPDGARPMRVVGTALLEEEGGHAAYDEGAWLTEAGLDRLEPAAVDWSLHVLDLHPDADAAAVRARLAAAGGVPDDARLAAEPAGLSNLRATQSLPALLAGVLALLGAGAVGHTLVTTVRRRRRDLAVLRALGLSGRQARAVVAWQATTVAAVGIVVGLPLGLVAGRLAWRWVATSMPLDNVNPTSGLDIAVVVPAALVVVNIIAAWPARAAAKAGPAAVLRAE